MSIEAEYLLYIARNLCEPHITQYELCRVQYAPELPEWQMDNDWYYVELPGICMGSTFA